MGVRAVSEVVAIAAAIAIAAIVFSIYISMVGGMTSSAASGPEVRVLYKPMGFQDGVYYVSLTIFSTKQPVIIRNIYLVDPLGVVVNITIRPSPPINIYESLSSEIIIEIANPSYRIYTIVIEYSDKYGNPLSSSQTIYLS